MYSLDRRAEQIVIGYLQGIGDGSGVDLEGLSSQPAGWDIGKIGYHNESADMGVDDAVDSRASGVL